MMRRPSIRSDQATRLPTPDAVLLRMLTDDGGTYEIAVTDPGSSGCLGMVWTASDVAKACGWSVVAVNAIGSVIGARGRTLDQSRPDLTLYSPSEARRIRAAAALMLSPHPAQPTETVERAEQPAACQALDDALADLQITGFTDLFDGIDGGLPELAMEISCVLRGIQTRADKTGRAISGLTRAMQQITPALLDAVLDQLKGGAKSLVDVIRDVRGRTDSGLEKPTAGQIIDAIDVNVRLKKIHRVSIRGAPCLVLA